jgi:hypothetical protein
MLRGKLGDSCVDQDLTAEIGLIDRVAPVAGPTIP